MKNTLILILLLSYNLSLYAYDIGLDTLKAEQNIATAREYVSDEKFDLSLPLIEEALGIYKQYELWDKYLDAKYILIKHYSKKYYTHGEEDLYKSKEVAEELLVESVQYSGENTFHEARANDAIGWFYNYLGFPEKALPYFERDMEISTIVLGAEDLPMGVRHYNIATANQSIGKIDAAIEGFSRAAYIFSMYMEEEGRQRPAIFNYVNAQVMLAINYNTAGKSMLALEHGEEARRVAEERSSANRSRMAWIYETLGDVYFSVEDVINAHQSYKTAINICNESPDMNRPLIARIYKKMGRNYQVKNKLDEAWEYYDLAYQTFEALEGDYYEPISNLLVDMGQLEYMRGNMELALTHYEASNTIVRAVFGDKPNETLAYSYLGMSDVHFKSGHLAKATDALTTARSYSIISNENLAKPAYYRSTDECWNNGLMLEVVALQAMIAIAEQRLDDAATVIDFARTKINSIRQEYVEDADKAELYKDFRQIYQLGVEANVKLYNQTEDIQYYDKAFQIAEENKSVLLSEAIQNEASQDFVGVPAPLLVQEKEYKVRIAQYEKKLIDAKNATEQNQEQIDFYQEQLMELRSAYNTFITTLEKDYPAYYKLRYQLDATTTNDIQALLTANDVLLEYFIAKDAIYIFKLTENRKAVYTVDFADCSEKVDKIRLWLSDVNYNADQPIEENIETFGALAYEFYQKIIAPLSIDKTKNKLIVIPDGSLNYIPFEVLVQEVPANITNYGDLAYLVKDFAIQYGFSADLLVKQRQISTAKTTHKTKELLAFAASYQQKSDSLTVTRSTRSQRLRGILQDLPAAQREVRQLEEMFAGQYYYGDAANEQTFKAVAADYPVIHLAMHGFLDEQNPMLSSLVFTEDGDSTEDNFLHAYELSNMKLNANLVVLSACETGYGKFQEGEGVLSLARSFVYAGVPSLVMSLWQVNDEATAKLMQSFYKNLENGTTKSVALQQAKISYLNEAKGIQTHPALWAAFVQVGDDSPVQLGTSSSQYWWYAVLGGVGLGVLALLLRRGRKE